MFSAQNRIPLATFMLLILGTMSASCGESGSKHGSLSVLLEPETTIVDGIAAGTGVENIRDGWSATFSKYIATIGDVHVNLATNELTSSDAHTVYVVDLAHLPAASVELWTFDALETGKWEFSYTTPAAGAGATRHSNVQQADFDAMTANGTTYRVRGTMTNSPNGESCPPANLAKLDGQTPNGNTTTFDDPCYDATTINFEIDVNAATTFDHCEVDKVPGVAVGEGTNAVAITIHGDHLFFNGFPEGDESGVTRLAQWLADCDLNLDGTVTTEELRRIGIGALAEFDSRFQLGAAPIVLNTMLDYVHAQLKTQGHFQGEGECAIDGAMHSHSLEL